MLTPSENNAPTVCPHCHNAVPGGARVCPHCGANVSPSHGDAPDTAPLLWTKSRGGDIATAT